MEERRGVKKREVEEKKKKKEVQSRNFKKGKKATKSNILGKAGKDTRELLILNVFVKE